MMSLLKAFIFSVILVSMNAYSDMVNVGGTMYRVDQQFTFTYSDTGASGTLDAAQAARFLQQNPKMRKVSEGVWDYGGDVGAANLSVDSRQKFDSD